jgi:hypothetical protein
MRMTLMQAAQVHADFINLRLSAVENLRYQRSIIPSKNERRTFEHSN